SVQSTSDISSEKLILYDDFNSGVFHEIKLLSSPSSKKVFFTVLALYHPALSATLAAGMEVAEYFVLSAVYQPAKMKPSFSGVGNVTAVPTSCEISFTVVPPFSSNTSIACQTAVSDVLSAGMVAICACSPSAFCQ